MPQYQPRQAVVEAYPTDDGTAYLVVREGSAVTRIDTDAFEEAFEPLKRARKNGSARQKSRQPKRKYKPRKPKASDISEDKAEPDTASTYAGRRCSTCGQRSGGPRSTKCQHCFEPF